MESEGGKNNSKLIRGPSRSFRLRNDSLNAVRLRRVFDLFDRNGDGVITVAEISLALNRLGLGADAGELDATVADFIPAGRSGLRFADFEALHRAVGDSLFGCPPPNSPDEEEGEEADEDMKEAFRVFDEDGDGFISAAELQAVLGKLGLPEARSIASVREMICSVDRDQDGRVDFGEFKCIMQGISVRGA